MRAHAPYRRFLHIAVTWPRFGIGIYRYPSGWGWAEDEVHPGDYCRVSF